ncbi:peptidase M15, partial [Paenibacillus odorifer]
LKEVMVKQGFKPYSKEWWHFTLIKEPFPKQYFDFKVE